MTVKYWLNIDGLNTRKVFFIDHAQEVKLFKYTLSMWKEVSVRFYHLEVELDVGNIEPGVDGLSYDLPLQ